MEHEKIYLTRSKRQKKGPSTVLSIDRGFYMQQERKKKCRVEKSKISLQSPKTELRPQNIKNKFSH
jgi:hypothetical protein